ncbi:MAG TPA: Na+/H+ antiporter NhaA [Candidatus Limnocylindria bacterium]|nr:Na+/H+ antiporter NhaA [Candidatus Limnocylindria bacterium]
MRRPLPTPLQPLRDFLRTESASGVLLVGASAVAVLWANLATASYDAVWSLPLAIGIGDRTLELDVRHWINDAAMALFFFVVGLEIKRELIDGELREPRHAALPVLAAAGGVIAPALIYLAFNAATPAAGGWGIPMATDIAFAVGVLTLVGRDAPVGLKVFLLSVAIVDDIVAIVLIAVFYSQGIDVTWLAIAAVSLAAFWLGWRLHAPLWRPGVLLLIAVGTWLAVHGSGVHATIAGVALGFLVPAAPGKQDSPAERLERGLHPWTSFLIVPLFALANAGVKLEAQALDDVLTDRVALGVFFGLVVGKFVGVAGTVYAVTRLRIATLPNEVTWGQMLGAAALAGIGFTVSLFITQLAFDDPSLTAPAKIAIFAASGAASIAGFVLLRSSSAPR